MQKSFVATIGFFDGLHIGHKKLIENVLQYSDLNKTKNLVITFDTVAKINNNLIYPLTTKLKLMKDLGVKNVQVLDFDKIKGLSPSKFFEKCILPLNIKTIFIGEKFKFGCNGSGNIWVLKLLCQKYNIALFIVKNVCIKINGKVCKVSSSLVRHYVHQNKFYLVEKLLGRKYFVTGKIFRGRGIGKKLGFPTINFYPDKNLLSLRGVFAGECVINGKTYPAVADFGHKPTINKEHIKKQDLKIKNFNKQISCEVHIIDKKINFKIKKVQFRPVKKIRDEKNFANLKFLSKKIESDIIKARKIL